ncbi:hypothetical protein MMC07_002254 [Pseudocyphellaria aurata]|nr:hypothetical protein [Pseudocyphellaria aurata]
MQQQWIGAISTSVDNARQLSYSVNSLPRLKRPHEQINSGPQPLHVLSHVSNITSALDHYKRQQLESCEQNTVEASEIVHVISEDSVEREGPRCSSETAGSSTLGSTLNPLLSLDHPCYGLPASLVANLSTLGISTIYPWQSSCLLGRGLLTGEKNLVYTAPTGGGKSLVADVLMLKRIIDDRTKKAILVLPYVALVQEKLKWLRRAVEGVHKTSNAVSQSILQLSKCRKRHVSDSIRVVGFFGGSKTRVTWSDVDIAANSLVNTAIEQCTIDDLGVVVLDELHMIDDDHRGYLMELMATKLLCLQRNVQIIGMSATLSNTQLLAKWLDANYYISQYKPVPIEEYLAYDHSIYRVSTSSSFFKTASQITSTHSVTAVNPMRMIRPSKYKELKDPLSNAVVSLAIETVSAGYGVLIFCGGRQACQSTALLVHEAMPGRKEITKNILDRRKDALSDLRSLSVGLDEILGKTILKGVAFHHAGMTIEERELVAEAYDKGVISVVVATCSLAAGINLPARRVILQGARMGRDLIGPAMLRQMRGRAGRKGKDEYGESFLCCKKADLEEVMQLVEADLPSVQSSLTPEKRGLKRALLEVITIRLATHMDAIQDYVRRTLLFHTMERNALNHMVDLTVEDLITSGLIFLTSTGSYEATLLSQAIIASSLTPEDGIFLHGELKRALQAFVMDGDMHIFYTFTPLQGFLAADINWPIFRREMEALDESGLRVLRCVGGNPAFINKMANSAKALPEGNAEEIKVARTYRRFYTAFQLRDLCNEVPIHAVARRFEVPRGLVQTLAQTCEGFAAGMIQFCDRMGWGMLKAALEHMSDRLKAGARADLLELARIPFVKSRTARVLWEHGLKSLGIVADADPKDLVPILLLVR